MNTTDTQPSLKAAKDLIDYIVNEGPLLDADDLMGQTDCPHGCGVEPDGVCHHGYLSAARTAGIL